MSSNKKLHKQFLHGRKHPEKFGDIQCGKCINMDSPNDKIGNPASLSCRISRGVTNSTPCCDQYAPIGHILATKVEAEIRKKSRSLQMDRAAKRFGEAITTGSLIVDLVTGGIGPGRVYVNAGPFHSGKSTELIEILRDAMDRGIPVKFYEAEAAFDWEYAAASGLPIVYNAVSEQWEHPYLETLEFECGDDWFKYMAKYLRALPRKARGAPQVLFACDSASVLIPRFIADNDDANPMAAQARMYSEGFMRMKSMLRAHRGALVFTNHIKEKPGSVYGDPRYMKGGSTLHEQSDIISWMFPIKSKVPQPEPKDRGIAVEPTISGHGKDRFVYAYHIFRKCRQAGAIDQRVYVRICFRSADGGKMGIDPAYDVFQYLVFTDQAEWSGNGRVTLYLHNVKYTGEMDKDGKPIINYPKIKGFYDKSMPWRNFRRLVMRLGKGKVKGPDLRSLARLQMVTGWAYTQYIEAQRDAK